MSAVKETKETYIGDYKSFCSIYIMALNIHTHTESNVTIRLWRYKTKQLNTIDTHSTTSKTPHNSSMFFLSLHKHEILFCTNSLHRLCKLTCSMRCCTRVHELCSKWYTYVYMCDLHLSLLIFFRFSKCTYYSNCMYEKANNNRHVARAAKGLNVTAHGYCFCYKA